MGSNQTRRDLAVAYITSLIEKILKDTGFKWRKKSLKIYTVFNVLCNLIRRQFMTYTQYLFIRNESNFRLVRFLFFLQFLIVFVSYFFQFR